MFAYANAQAERQSHHTQYQAWMTASLTGFAKVPAYEKVFPPVVRRKTKPSSADLFAYFDGVRAERKAKIAYGR